MGAKLYTTICNAAPSEILARIAIKARERILERNRSIIATTLLAFDAFFAEFKDLFDGTAPDGGCVSYSRYRGNDGVENFCKNLPVRPASDRRGGRPGWVGSLRLAAGWEAVRACPPMIAAPPRCWALVRTGLADQAGPHGYGGDGKRCA